MANVSYNGGLRYHADGGGVKVLLPVVALATNADDIYVGDPVRSLGIAETGTDLLSIERADAGETIFGVVHEVRPDTDDSLKYRVGSTRRELVIETNLEHIEWEIEEDGVGGTLGLGAVGQVADLVGAGSGSALSGASSMELDSSTAATGSSAQVRIMRLAKRVGNEIGSGAKYVVKINELQINRGDTGGNGI